MTRSISIINTEIQLINVIEAIHHFKPAENYLVIGQFNIKPDRIHKIEKMLMEPLFSQHFKKIVHLPLYLSNKNPFRFVGYALAYIKFFFLILFQKKFDFCFFGVVTDIIVKPIVYLTQYKNPKCLLCVIDEGGRVIVDAKERAMNERNIILQNSHPKRLLSGFIQAINRTWIYPSLTYFSVFQLSLLPQDKLIHNDYVFFKANQLQNSQLKKRAVVMVGIPLCEHNRIPLVQYQKIINTIIAKYDAHPIYYAPHPMETEYVKWMPKHVTLLHTHYPLELVILANHAEMLIGFGSTALFNCAAMKICNNSISISLDEPNNEGNAEVKAWNRELLNVGVQVVKPDFFLE